MPWTEDYPVSDGRWVYPDGVIRIPRIAILWYIVKKKKPTAEESDVAKYYALIEEKVPLIKMIKEIWETFHALLMGSDPDKLDEFISSNVWVRAAALTMGSKSSSAVHLEIREL